MLDISTSVNVLIIIDIEPFGLLLSLAQIHQCIM
jgi:hypothetical protein